MPSIYVSLASSTCTWLLLLGLTAIASRTAVAQEAVAQEAVAQEAVAQDVPEAIFKYAAREDSVFAWELKQKQSFDAGTLYDVDLTSQEWKGIVWQHVLQIAEPKELRYPNHVLLFVTGGSQGRRPGRDDIQRGLGLARLCGARVATIHQVPNQPLLDGRHEDDLITETWLRYLDTGDEEWPLLFPMVKSAVRAMDAIEALAEQEWKGKVEGFVITGASKRGWTSWLTPVVDQRVIATAPIVIDVLNFRAQMKHQMESWGKYSEQIIDYTSKGLIVEGEENPRERQLRLMMDPFTYRRQLTLPKLLVNGTNDRYWVVDAMHLYWDDLVGDKYILQVPNAGHGLDGGQPLALSTIAAFFQYNASGKKMPEISWQHTVDAHNVVLDVASTPAPKAARLWVARSDSKDFRESRWNSESLDASSGTCRATVELPTAGHVAHYVELQYEINGLPHSFCTLIRSD